MQKILVVCGPTAIGKTQLALTIARTLLSSIVSVDSRQMYVGLDIGAGKDIPPGFNRKISEIGLPVYSDGNIDIYGYDLFKPTRLQSPSQLEKKLSRVLDHLDQKNVLPILVSGSGNYLHALLSPPKTASIPPNPQLRGELEVKTVTELQEQLRIFDQEKLQSMNQSDRNNPRRLIRAIEVASNANFDSFLTTQVNRFDLLWIGLTAPKEILEASIKQRVESRILHGMIEETQGLIQEYPECESVLRVTLGYQQVLAFLAGEISKDLLKTIWSLKEFQYAKRQMTWFKKNQNIHWFDSSELSIDTSVMNLLQSWKGFAHK